MSKNVEEAKARLIKSIGRQIRGLRIQAGMTQNELASQLKREVEFVQKAEGQDNALSVYEYLVIVKALGFDPATALSELLTGE